MPGYAEDLAYIHDAGFSGFITEAAPGLLALLRKQRIGGGHVVDLGCGSGRWAAMLGSAGYKVTGIDQSAAMIRMARKIAPAAKFHTASLWGAALPPCDAVTAIGECVNYTFDGERGLRDLRLLFRRAGHALRPGGLFVFDFATPLRIPDPQPAKSWYSGEDWTVLVETAGRRQALERKVISFRQRGNRYRRSEEVHRLRLWEPGEVAALLEREGFRAKLIFEYGRLPLPPGIAAFAALRIGGLDSDTRYATDRA